jgi:hypothetical protein
MHEYTFLLRALGIDRYSFIFLTGFRYAFLKLEEESIWPVGLFSYRVSLGPVYFLVCEFLLPLETSSETFHGSSLFRWKVHPRTLIWKFWCGVVPTLPNLHKRFPAHPATSAVPKETKPKKHTSLFAVQAPALFALLPQLDSEPIFFQVVCLILSYIFPPSFALNQDLAWRKKMKLVSISNITLPKCSIPNCCGIITSF